MLSIGVVVAVVKIVSNIRRSLGLIYKYIKLLRSNLKRCRNCELGMLRNYYFFNCWHNDKIKMSNNEFCVQQHIDENCMYEQVNKYKRTSCSIHKSTKFR